MILALALLTAAVQAPVERAWAAIEESNRFVPEEWAGETPEGRIVLDELTTAARATYRSRRAGFRATLGRALAEAGRPEAALIELRRAAALAPNPETFEAIAALPGLPIAERVEALLLGWRAGGGRDPSIRDALAATGAFPHADAMAAAVERFRFGGPERDRLRIPDAVALGEFPFPEMSLAVSGGVWSSRRSFGEGRVVVVYLPRAGCGRCGEVLDGLQTMLRTRGADVIAAVEDADLPLVTRIAELAGAGFFQPEPQVASTRARIGGRPIAHVVRRAVVPPEFDEEGTLWVATRSGFLVFRAPLGEDPVRRSVGPLLRLFDEPPFPGGAKPLAGPPDDAEGLIRAIAPLEALGNPVGALEERLAEAVRRELRTGGDPMALLERASAIRAGDLARRRLLSARFPRIGDRLLEAAQGLDPTILRASASGLLRTAVGDGSVGLQRAYEREDGSVVLLHATVGADGAAQALEVVPGPAGGVVRAEDGFRFAHGACVSWGETACPAQLRGSAVVVRLSQLVTEGDAPMIQRRVDGGSEDEAVAALLRGLDAFAEGRWEDAARAFEAAVPGPGSPVEEAARRYNLATTLARLGDRDAALGMLEEIGDATFHPLVESAVRELYRATPDPRVP